MGEARRKVKEGQRDIRGVCVEEGHRVVEKKRQIRAGTGAAEIREKLRHRVNEERGKGEEHRARERQGKGDTEAGKTEGLGQEESDRR